MKSKLLSLIAVLLAYCSHAQKVNTNMFGVTINGYRHQVAFPSHLWEQSKGTDLQPFAIAKWCNSTSPDTEYVTLRDLGKTNLAAAVQADHRMAERFSSRYVLTNVSLIDGPLNYKRPDLADEYPAWTWCYVQSETPSSDQVRFYYRRYVQGADQTIFCLSYWSWAQSSGETNLVAVQNMAAAICDSWKMTPVYRWPTNIPSLTPVPLTLPEQERREHR